MDSQFSGGGDELVAGVFHGRAKKRRFDEFQQLLIKIPSIFGTLELNFRPLPDKRGDRPPVDGIGYACGKHGRRKMFGGDYAALGKDHRVLYGVAQFADVAVPIAAFQFGDCLG